MTYHAMAWQNENPRSLTPDADQIASSEKAKVELICQTPRGWNFLFTEPKEVLALMQRDNE